MKNMEWKEFSKELPTNKRGEQIDILFGHPIKKRHKRL